MTTIRMRFGIRFTLPSLLCAFVNSWSDAQEVKSTFYQHEIVERSPLVVRVALVNEQESSVATEFSFDDLGWLLERTVLIIEDSSHSVCRIPYRSAVLICRQAPDLQNELVPHGTIEMDVVFILAVGIGAQKDLQFLRPGEYTCRVEVIPAYGERLSSTSTDVRIIAPKPIDTAARDGISSRHVFFLEGHDVPLSSADYDGRQFHGRVNVARFGELESITRDFSTSPYAEWIRFWKLYHHGPKEDVMRYAREHKNFPLSDNLMLRAADGLFDAKRYDEARQTVDELLQLFPDGDTKQPAERLMEKLRDKE